MNQLIKTFKALSDPNRVRIIKMLQVRALCVCEITEILNLSPSTVSKHLSLLREADLIVSDKNKKWVNYRINEAAWNPYTSEIHPLLDKWLNEEDQVITDRHQVKHVDRFTITS